MTYTLCEVIDSMCLVYAQLPGPSYNPDQDAY